MKALAETRLKDLSTGGHRNREFFLACVKGVLNCSFPSVTAPFVKCTCSMSLWYGYFFDCM